MSGEGRWAKRGEQWVKDRIVLDGVVYVREGLSSAIEPSYTVTELSELSGFPASTIYSNIKRHELSAVMPNGTTKGMRILDSEWGRFLREKSSA